MLFSKTYIIKYNQKDKFFVLADGKQKKDDRKFCADKCESLEKELNKLGIKYKLSAMAAEMKKKFG